MLQKLNIKKVLLRLPTLNINVNDIVRSVLDSSKYRALVVNLVQERLYNKGTYANDNEIVTYKAKSPDVYSRYTMALKQEKNQPTNRVTLKDGGEFYNTFALKTETESFSISYDENKPDGKISDNISDLPVAISLSDSDLNVLRDDIKVDIIKKMREKII